MLIGILFGAACITGGMVWLLRNIDSNTALGLIILGVVVIFTSTVFAHDHDRPGLNDWYTSLKSGKGPCCDGPGKDAKHLSSEDWESKDGHYRVRIDGKWIDVDDSAVLKQPNRDGRTLVWLYWISGEPYARCFIPGMMM